MRRLTVMVVILFYQFMAVGQSVRDVSLPNVVDGKKFSFSNLQKEKILVIIFFSGKCAYGDYYLERILTLEHKFSKQMVKFILVNSNSSEYVSEESVASMKKFAGSHSINFPYLADKEKKLKTILHAARTPEVFVLEPGNDFSIAYRGAIDDNAQSASDVSHAYLEEALINLLANKKVELNQTRPVGCLIK